MQIFNYVFKVFKLKMNVVLSWGFHNAIGSKNSLMFMVEGFLHSGTVIVDYDEGADLFNITLIDHDGNKVKVIEGVYVDQLVQVIDENVERTTDYENRIRNHYNLN